MDWSEGVPHQTASGGHGSGPSAVHYWILGLMHSGRLALLFSKLLFHSIHHYMGGTTHGALHGELPPTVHYMGSYHLRCITWESPPTVNITWGALPTVQLHGSHHLRWTALNHLSLLFSSLVKYIFCCEGSLIKENELVL